MRRPFLKQSFIHFVVISCSCAVFLLWTKPVMAEGQSQSDIITVEEAVQTALEQNLGLKVQEQDLEIARGELLKARVFANPELELRGETDAIFSNEGEGVYSVSLGQTFFIAPKRRYRIGIAELNLGRTQKAIENTRRLLVAEVKEAFYAILLLQERLKFAEELIGINERFVQLTEGRFREGFSPELDVNLARIQLQQARRNRTEIEKDLSVAKASLNFLLGRPAQAALMAQGEFMDQEISLDPSRLKQAAFTQRADLAGQEVSLNIAGKEINLARADRIPDVTLSFDYTQERSIFSEMDLSDRDRLAGLRLSVPLPFFDRKQGEIARARAQKEKADLELTLLRAVVEKEIINAVSRVQATQQTLQLFGGGILPLAEDHFHLTQKAYGQGQAGILDVMEAQRRFSETRLGYLATLYEYNLALTEIERVVGTSLAALRR